MENNELERKIMNNVRNKIVVSNLEKEADMRISKRRAIISVTALILIFMSGSFLTVNAATDGQLAKDVKDLINVTFNQADYKPIETKEYTTPEGTKRKEYRFESTDGTAVVDIIDEGNTEFDISYEIEKDGTVSTTINDKLGETKK